MKACPQCQENGRTQTREPLLPHEIPTGPWQVIATDIFTLHGEDYLLVVDYYSKFPIIRRLPTGRSTSQNVITFLKQIFSEHGIPSKLVSDNGSQYSSHLFNEFTRKWGFQHITSSPTYPQSNGLAERFVQTVKNIVDKTVKNKGDIYLSLLSLRSTPIDHNLPSPAELLFNRKVRSTLPTRIPNTNPQKDRIAEQLQNRQTNQKNYFDNKSASKAPLIPGQQVYVQQQTGKKRWESAQVQAQCEEPRSYEVVTTTGQTLRRNRRHIKESSNKVSFDPDPDVLIYQPAEAPANLQQTTPTHNSDTHYQYKQVSKTQQTRAGRQTKARKLLDL